MLILECSIFGSISDATVEASLAVQDWISVLRARKFPLLLKVHQRVPHQPPKQLKAGLSIVIAKMLQCKCPIAFFGVAGRVLYISCSHPLFERKSVNMRYYLFAVFIQ